MAKLLSILRAHRNHGNKTSQLTMRLMAPNYTTIVAPSPPSPESNTHRLAAANFNFNNGRPKTTSPNPVPMIGLITGLFSTGNPCVDLLFNVIKPEKVSPAEVEATCMYLKQLLPLAWSHNPLTTLKLICNLRGEKFFMEAFDTAAYWLHHNHPKTLLCNIPSIAISFGCFTDPAEILYFLLEGRERRRGDEEEAAAGSGNSQEKTLAEITTMAIERYERDPNYKLLHDRVTDVYVEHLKSDIEILKQKLMQSDIDDDDRYCLGSEITDAARNCFSENSMDVHIISATLLLESIAKKFYPRESYPQYQGVDEVHYAEKIGDRLRKEVLVPLVNASRVGRINKPCEVEMYLEEVKADKSKVAVGALVPYQIIAFADHPNVGELAELQWKTMVEDMKKQGKMNNCLAVCEDGKRYLGNMTTEVSLALGLLVSELNEGPWKGRVINYTEYSPQIHLVQGHDLKSKCEFLRKMDFRGSDSCFINYMKVFDSILEVVVRENLEPEQMIKKVFVFSHQDSCHEDNLDWWEIGYEEIKRKFEEKGYGGAVPHLVLWYMSGLDFEWEKFRMPCIQPGLTILSGFSNNLLKLFLDKGGEIGAEHVMEAVISEEEYQKLAVVD